jgi:hypothetical protein
MGHVQVTSLDASERRMLGTVRAEMRAVERDMYLWRARDDGIDEEEARRRYVVVFRLPEGAEQMSGALLLRAELVPRAALEERAEE